MEFGILLFRAITKENQKKSWMSGFFGINKF